MHFFQLIKVLFFRLSYAINIACMRFGLERLELGSNDSTFFNIYYCQNIKKKGILGAFKYFLRPLFTFLWKKGFLFLWIR